MKQNSQKQQAGVWLDNEKALIITNGAQSERGDYAILEKVKAQEGQSGGGEHTINNAKKSDSLKYFKTVSALLLGYDEIFVFGPGKSQEQFQNHLNEDGKFKSKKITIDSSDQLTDPQMVARVRDFFDAHQN